MEIRPLRGTIIGDKAMKLHTFQIAGLAFSMLSIVSITLAQAPKADAKEAGLQLSVGLISSPTREAWAFFSGGIFLSKHQISGLVLFPELANAYETWNDSIDERSAKVAFALSHGFQIMHKGRFAIETHSVFQIQRMIVHTTNVIDPLQQKFIRSYPRLSFQAGLGLRYMLHPKISLFQSVRYGFSTGNFRVIYPKVTHIRSGLCVELSLGLKL